jgi:hypothetical protein
MIDKISYLKNELKKYQKKLVHMAKEYAMTKEGSAYGVEYYDIQCRVLQSMVEGIEKEILELKRKKG